MGREQGLLNGSPTSGWDPLGSQGPAGCPRRFHGAGTAFSARPWLLPLPRILLQPRHPQTGSRAPASPTAPQRGKPPDPCPRPRLHPAALQPAAVCSHPGALSPAPGCEGEPWPLVRPSHEWSTWGLLRCRVSGAGVLPVHGLGSRRCRSRHASVPAGLLGAGAAPSTGHHGYIPPASRIGPRSWPVLVLRAGERLDGGPGPPERGRGVRVRGAGVSEVAWPPLPTAGETNGASQHHPVGAGAAGSIPCPVPRGSPDEVRELTWARCLATGDRG